MGAKWMARQKSFGFGFLLAFAAVAATPAKADFNDLLSGMDTTTAQYQTEACAAARSETANFDEKVAARFVEGAAFGAAFGIFGLPMAASIDAQKARERNAALSRLIIACGAETFLPYIKSKSLENDAKTQAWVGLGFASEKEWPEAIAWYQKAVDQNNSDAETNLGAIYGDGNGVPQDYTRAIALWQHAANQGSTVAQTDMGEMYLDGKGVGQDAGQAFDLFRKAARLGDTHAQFLLATLYEKGEGTGRNIVQAYEWYSISARGGYGEAGSKRDAIATQISRDQTYRANADALRCKAAIYQCE